MSKPVLDEMQLQKRNKIGHQAFMLMSYLIFADIGLNGFGIRWLNYPVNVFVIVLLCMSYYLVRIVWSNAYVGPAVSSKPVWVRVVLTVAVAVASGVLAAVLATKGGMARQTADSGDNGAVVLLVVSLTGLVVAAVVGMIRYRRNKENDG